jgi:hypothetical protein
MRLLSFEVEGFKNLVAPVRLTDLADVNVLHGENNVGKSNVLRAMEVFFALLGTTERAWLPVVQPQEYSAERLSQLGIRRADLFNYAAPAPVRFDARLAIDPQELAKDGIKPLLDVHNIAITMVVAPRLLDDAVTMQVTSFRFADGTDASAVQVSAERKEFVMRFAAFLTASFLGKQPVPTIDTVPGLQAVVDALYDAQISDDRRQALQWDRFAESMTGFADILGDGRFLAVLPRTPERQAQLLFETPSMRVPLRALGTGVQRIVELIGTVVTSGASMVLVEEPEVHLRWALQERVRDALAGLVGKPGAPSQLILTSHSGAFEFGDHFYWMKKGDPGPTIERMPINMAPVVVGQVADPLVGEIPAVPTYMSTEGVLRVPARIRKAIGVEHGGGVCFVDKENGVAEMMSDATFMRLAGLDDGDT